MAALQPENWPDVLEPTLREIFTSAALGRPDPAMERLFGIRPSTRYTEHYLNTGALPRVPRFEGTVQYQRFDGGYRTDITNIELAQGIEVSRAMMDDELYGIVAEEARALGDAFALTREIDAADIFNNAFTSTTYRLGDSTLGADGVVLASASHPLSPIRSGSVQSNAGTSPLSIDSWDTTRLAGRALTDDRGEKTGVNYNVLLIPPGLERTARQIFDPRAQWEPGSGEFNLNVFSAGVMSTVTIVVWDYLTDANNWFALDSRIMPRQLVWQERVPLEFGRDSLIDALIAKYRGYCRYGRGFTGWQFAFGHAVT